MQQGDPLGPVGFSLVLHRLLKSIQESVPNLRLNVWYLDDGTLVGTIEDIKKALDVIDRRTPSWFNP